MGSMVYSLLWVMQDFYHAPSYWEVCRPRKYQSKYVCESSRFSAVLKRLVDVDPTTPTFLGILIILAAQYRGPRKLKLFF